MKGKSPETTPPQKNPRTLFLARSPLFPGVMLVDLSPSSGMPFSQEWQEILSFRTPAAHYSPPQSFSCSSRIPDKALLLDKKLAGKFQHQLLPNWANPVLSWSRGSRMHDWEITARPSLLPARAKPRMGTGVSQSWLHRAGGRGWRKRSTCCTRATAEEGAALYSLFSSKAALIKIDTWAAQLQSGTFRAIPCQAGPFSGASVPGWGSSFLQKSGRGEREVNSCCQGGFSPSVQIILAAGFLPSWCLLKERKGELVSLPP